MSDEEIEDKKTDDKEMKEIDDPLQALADYIVNGIERKIGKNMNDLVKHTLEGLTEQNKLLNASVLKLGKDAENITNKYNDFLHLHNQEAGAWSILKMTLETRIHQLQMDKGSGKEATEL